MKLIDVKALHAKKVENRQGLFQKDIVGAPEGAKAFTFHLSIMEKGGHGQLHTHPHSEHLLVVRQGELIVRNSKESHRVPVDSAILIYPGEEHEIINSYDGTSEYWVIYSPPR